MGRRDLTTQRRISVFRLERQHNIFTCIVYEVQSEFAVNRNTISNTSESPIVLYGFVIIYMAWFLASFFLSPFSFCAVWCHPTSCMITRRLLTWAQILKGPHMLHNFNQVYPSIQVATRKWLVRYIALSASGSGSRAREYCLGPLQPLSGASASPTFWKRINTVLSVPEKTCFLKSVAAEEVCEKRMPWCT